MSEQDGRQTATKRRRNRQTNKQDGTQAPALQRPVNDDKEAWNAYWTVQGHPWRTEPEIDEERQRYLAQRRVITPDIKQGIYPFKDIKLNRADVEWLLATHESGGIRGPVDWNNESQQRRNGIDLRGANLRGENLYGLPLARMRGGLTLDESIKVGGEHQKFWDEMIKVTEKQRSFAAVHLEEADLRRAQLQEAGLEGAHLEKAFLEGAQLQKANLWLAQLQGAYLKGAQLKETILREAQLQEASLMEAQLQGAILLGAQLQGANLREAQLQGANLREAQLQGASLWLAQLKKASLMGTQLQGSNLREANLDGARLNYVTLSDQKYGSARLAHISWGAADLSRVDWGHVKRLGEEQVAQQEKDDEGKIKDKQTRLDEYKEAVRANRQLAVVLRDQGLNEEADYFAYRAQVLQRKRFWFQMKGQQVKFSQRVQSLGRWLSSWFLNVVAGYGYKPQRCFVIYLLALIGFTLAHYIVGAIDGHSLTFINALAVSVQSLHGRLFSFQSGDPQTLLNTVEAFVGLFIEAIVVAVITQRILGR